ncbi:hypothetical protein DDE82_008817 [Stemphylium lycopersici]|uniref:Uncharacterized protein n=1 Tax=Stemphylium lycopersici TaxID=183478 RepID=A0A364MT15_STELY|nr:hypothetical protein TW65_08872 [Stemphylium lycopersici]RAQ98876.1 hypothetical protein DDE82_008817 [Stemphylium lycopersici]RAR02665.1 hypothetical protein DDE83_008502 [Stemphylium lycopersici]
MVSYGNNYPDLGDGPLGEQFFPNDFIHSGHQSPPPGMPAGNRNLAPQQPGDLPRNDVHDSNSNQTLDEIVQLLKQVVVTVVDHKKENDEFRRKFEEVLKKQDQSLKMLDQSFKLLEYLKRPIFDMASLVKRTVSGRGPARSRPDFSSQIIAPFETPMWSDQPDPSQASNYRPAHKTAQS